MHILAIESSCDETAAAILTDGRRLLANVVDSQIAVHGRYGGVVPELASRKHIENIYPVVEAALAEADLDLDAIDAVAVTRGPGLIGSLLVGLSFAKALAWARGLPCIGIDHLDAHLASIFFAGRQIRYPCVTLVVSGGHTSIYRLDGPTTSELLGRTLDDAAGEAFDKVAKLLGLPYPGGPIIGRLAESGDRTRFSLPRAWLDKDSLDFSFSGLKTAVALLVRDMEATVTGQRSAPSYAEVVTSRTGYLVTGRPRCKEEARAAYWELRKRADDAADGVPCDQIQATDAAADICASFQEAVVDVLVTKTMQAARRHQAAMVALAGGVAANKRLRAVMAERAAAAGLPLAVPPVELCTDNAAMVAMAAWLRADAIDGLDLGMDVYSRATLAAR